MKNSLILHHYEKSPYAEKVRLMFGLTQSHWYSSITEIQPPRPGLDPLTGGYRRIPVAQSGADIFCDTALIAQEIADAHNAAALDITQLDDAALALVHQAEKEAFFSAIGAVPSLRLLGTMLRSFGPVGMYRFAKDRAALMQGGTVRPPKGDKAKAVFAALLQALEEQLQERSWIGGDEVSIADLAVYHPLWLHVSCNRRELDAGPKVTDWYRRVAKLGHGQREELTRDQVFSIARESEPRPLPTDATGEPDLIGTTVAVAPSDYGTVAVQGTLAACTEDRIILLRQTPEFGDLHVHFPRAGYSLTAC